MDPVIRNRPAFKVLGIHARVNPATADYGDLWGNRFAARQAEIAPLSTDGIYYAVYFCAGEEGLVDLVVGMAVDDVPGVPEGLVLREVAAAKEAVFTCTLDGISATWGQIYGGWLEGSGFEHDDASADYECFPPEFSPQGGTLALHVPVRERRS